MNKNKKDIEDILNSIAVIQKNLDDIIGFSIKYIESLIERFAVNFPRRTVIEDFKKVDKKAAALNNIKVGWDRKSCYIGSSIKAVESLACNEFDNLICIDKTGVYKIITIPHKMYVGRLYYFNKYSDSQIFCLVYKDKKKGIYYIKRCRIDKFIKDKEYMIIPKDCQLEFIANKDKAIYECKVEIKKGRNKQTGNLLEINFSQIQMRSPAARGFRFTDKKILKFKYIGQAEESLSTDDEGLSEEEQSIDVSSHDVSDSKIEATAKAPIIINNDIVDSVPKKDEVIKVESVKVDVVIEPVEDAKFESASKKVVLKVPKKIVSIKKETKVKSIPDILASEKITKIKDNVEISTSKVANVHISEKSEKLDCIAEKDVDNHKDNNNKDQGNNKDLDKDNDLDQDKDWGIIQPGLGF